MEGKMNDRISRRQFLKVSAFTAASVAAAACAQPAAPAAPETEAPAADAEVAEGGVPQGGIIRYKGSGGRTTYFSPLWFYETTAWHNTMKLVWPGLVIHNTEGGMDPYLAESFEVGGGRGQRHVPPARGGPVERRRSPDRARRQVDL